MPASHGRPLWLLSEGITSAMTRESEGDRHERTSEARVRSYVLASLARQDSALVIALAALHSLFTRLSGSGEKLILRQHVTSDIVFVLLHSCTHPVSLTARVPSCHWQWLW